MICRAANRIFVGVPLCRDYDYQTLTLTFAINVMKYGLIIGPFPEPLKPCVVSSIRLPFTEARFSIVSRMLSNLPFQIQQQIELIGPMVEERFAKMEEYGDDWDDKPVCQTFKSGIFLITWLIHRTICSCGS